MRYINLVFSLFTLFISYNLLNSGYSWYMDLEQYSLTNIMISIKATPLANFFALLISASYILISIFSFRYKLSKTFYMLLAILTSSMMLIVYANDYLLFFVGWEVMSLSIYFLLSFSLSKQALQRYIIFAMASALSMFGAIFIIYSTTHTLSYSSLSSSFHLLSDSMKYIFIALMLISISIKVGAIGFHYWIIDSYEQSHNIFTPYLSGVVSKIGIYAFIILTTQVVESLFILAILGVISSVVATFKAIQEDSMKRLLAYSSIAQLGYIVTVLSLSEGLGGALYHSLIHTVVKLLLFINVAGIIYETQRDKLSNLGGLIYKMPQSFVLLLIGIIALAGMPPLGGFASKFMIYTSLFDAKYLLTLIAVMFSSASAFLYVYKLIYGIYLGQPTNKKLETVKEVGFAFLFPQYILSIILIITGTFPALIVPYLNTILTDLHKTTIEYNDISTLITPHATYNGLVVMSAFGVIFIAVLVIIYFINSKAKQVKNRFDIAYCGEVPNEASHLHYGYGMGKELKRVGFISIIIKKYTKLFYDFLTTQTLNLSEIIRKIYTGKLITNFNIAIFFTLILFWWGLK